MRIGLTLLVVLGAIATASSTSVSNSLAVIAKSRAEGGATAGDDKFVIKASSSFNCATIHHNAKKQEDEIVQAPCRGAGASNQQFQMSTVGELQPVDPAYAGKCVTVREGRKMAGNKLILENCNAEQWQRFETTELTHGNNEIHFISKNWTFYCAGINDFDHNVRIYGCDHEAPYQKWIFNSNQYIKLPDCNNGDYPEQPVRCGQKVYLYQANTNSVAWIRFPQGNDIDVHLEPDLKDRKAWEVDCPYGQDGDRVTDGAAYCLKQNRRFLVLNEAKQWTQTERCSASPRGETLLRFGSYNEDKSIMYACRDPQGQLQNFFKITGEKNGYNDANGHFWMSVGAHKKVKTSVAQNHPETRMYFVPA